MKKKLLVVAGFALIVAAGCESKTEPTADSSSTPAAQGTGQSGVQDDASQKNVVQVAIGSKDHTTLVTAVKAAELVDALSNAGPFTVFAPTNAAFDKLPAGTVEGLLKPEKKEALTDILQYHVSVGVYKAESLQDGQILGQIMLNGTDTIVASVPASNGIIHVIDGVLLPPPAKN